MPWSNEVYVDKNDKNRIVELLKEAETILNKYPYWAPNTEFSGAVTTMTRAKNAMKDAVQWCGYLEVKK